MANASHVKRKIIFSIDDGPRHNSTDEILEILRKYGIKAIFFINGNANKAKSLGLDQKSPGERIRPRLGNDCDISKIGSIKSHGHLIGNHTFSHYGSKDSVTDARCIRDFKALHGYVKEHHGYEMKYWRMPGGRKKSS